MRLLDLDLVLAGIVSTPCSGSKNLKRQIAALTVALTP
jgi:hypothetical protein